MLENLPYAQFNPSDGEKLIQQVKNFSPSGNIILNTTSKNSLGLALDKTVTLKHSRSGRHSIDGQLYECLRVSSVGIVYKNAHIMVMDAINGAQLVLVPTHDPFLLVFFINMKTSFDTSLELSQGEYRKYMREVFQGMTMVSEKLGNQDLWVPNFRIKAVVDNTMNHTLRKSEGIHVNSTHQGIFYG